MEQHNETPVEEMASYFSSLPSRPRMLARTNYRTPYRPMIRVLAPIADAAITSRWSDALRGALIDCLQERQPCTNWTGFMPLKIEARPTAWDTAAPESNNFLLVCVAPETTEWHQALDIALKCKAVLSTYGITMDVIVTEMVIVTPGGTTREVGEPKDTNELKFHTAPDPVAEAGVELLDIFDIRYSMAKSNRILPDVNLAVLPFLPLPGQSLQPLAPKGVDKELPAGSLGCFIRLKDERGVLSETVYGLTSRHVAVQGAYDHYSVFNSEAESDTSGEPNCKNISVACGSMAAIEKQKRELQLLKHLSAQALRQAATDTSSVGEPSDEKHAEFGLIRDCVHNYLPAIQSAVEALGSRDGSSPKTRHVGTVAFAAEHDIDDEGFWKDWALVAVSPHGPTNSLQYSNFHHSKLLLDNWQDVARRVLVQLGPGDACDDVSMATTRSKDDADLLTIRAPHPPMLFWGRDARSAPRVVMKRGAASNLTVGLLSPIEAVLRRPLPNKDTIAWAWPVLSPILSPPNAVQQGMFSTDGDSGSMVVDLDGTAVGMVDTGFGCDDNLANMGEPSQPKIDIPLITPIDRIFASVEAVTGRTPHII